MEENRRDFLKKAGIFGLGATSFSLFTACNNPGEEERKLASEAIKSSKDWREDTEWRKVKYGSWRGPGVPSGPGPMDSVLLKDYAPKSSIVAEETFIPKAMFPVIDVHVHPYYPEQVEGKGFKEALAQWVQIQKEVGVKTSVVLTGATGEEFDKLVEIYLEPYPEQFQLYCGVLGTDIDKPDYPQRAVAELERCYKKGACGVGEITDKGYGITRNRELASDERLHYTDIRLDSFWSKCAELSLPVNIHLADHPSSWQPPDVFQERTPIFQQFNQSEEDGLPYHELLKNLPPLLEKHPETTFIACHLANLGNDLQRLGSLLDQYPNLYLDISARDYEVGRQPRASAKFIAAYPTRVLFGTDMGMAKSMYQSWWRLLESDDEHMTGRVWWRYYGLSLPAPVLENLYHDNAMKVLNWRTVNV